MNLRDVANEAINGVKKDQAMDVIIGVLNGTGDFHLIDSEDEGIPSLEKHDRRFHGGHFDKETMTCKLRDDLAKTDKPDELLERHSRALSGISNKKAEEYIRLMKKKCPQLDPEETLEKIAEIGDTKLQGDAFRWLMKGAVRLPEDMYKVKQAREMADRSKTDPMQYNTPQACIDALRGKVTLKEKPIDPDTVPELSDKKTLPMGVTTYLVQDDQAGQRAMRKIIDTHWGEDANPWCLLARTTEDEADEDFNETMRDWWYNLDLEKKKEVLIEEGYEADEVEGFVEDGDIYLSDIDEQAVENYYYKHVETRYDANDPHMRTAWHYWNHYNALPKRVAFKDGKLLAFMATDGVDLNSIDEGESQLSEMFPDQYAEYEEWMETDEGKEEQASFIEWMSVNYPELADDEEIRKMSPEQWWDRQDASHEGIPLGNMNVPNDPFERYADFEIRDGKPTQVGGFHKGTKGQNGYREWFQRGTLHVVQDNDIYMAFMPDGDLTEYSNEKTGEAYSFHDDGSLAYVSWKTPNDGTKNTVNFMVGTGTSRLIGSGIRAEKNPDNSLYVEDYDEKVKAQFTPDGSITEIEPVYDWANRGSAEPTRKELNSRADSARRRVLKSFAIANDMKLRANDLREKHSIKKLDPHGHANLRDFLKKD